MTASITVRIPAALRAYTGGEHEVRVRAHDVRGALNALGTQHPAVLPRILEPGGEVRQFVNVFVGDTRIDALAGMDTRLPEDATLTILPSVAGG